MSTIHPCALSPCPGLGVAALWRKVCGLRGRRLDSCLRFLYITDWLHNYMVKYEI